MKLIKYRDYRDKDYSWFWVTDDKLESVLSPTFSSKEEATKWYGQQLRRTQNDS